MAEKKQKYIPKGKHEKEEQKTQALITISHCHPPNIMYVGIIETTIEGNFYGKIMLKHVS